MGKYLVIFIFYISSLSVFIACHCTAVCCDVIRQMSFPGENRERYLQLLLHGLYTPWTLPVGSSEQALQSLVDSLAVNTLNLPKPIMNSL